MSGLIILSPRYHRNYISMENYYALFDRLVEKDNFEIFYADDVDGDGILTDYVLLFGSPENWQQRFAKNLIRKLPDSVRLITYLGDIHFNSDLQDFSLDAQLADTQYREAMTETLNRSDIILCAFKSTFMKYWFKWRDKFVFFPMFISKKAYEKIPFKQYPLTKCLISGVSNNVVAEKFYPLRNYIVNTPNKKVDILNHPGYNININDYDKTLFSVGDEYKYTLNTYLGDIATSSVTGYVVQKYFEIPASGSLLLAEYVPDMLSSGFVEGYNFVKITRENIFDVVENVCSNPLAYINIRNQSRNWVFKYHTEENRYEQLKGVLKCVL